MTDVDIKIIGFDIAKKLIPGEKATRKCGSAGYIPPEIFAGSSYGFEADIFSCGIILYIL